VAAGALLESASAGLLQTKGAGVALFSALEAVDNGAGVTAARIRVEAL
jgi:hypothetical protein